ncbi:MAG: PEP-CTERM sorting domain-containing protein [Verrucomicrobiota bacterium]
MKSGSIVVFAACSLASFIPSQAAATFVYHFNIGGDPVFSGTSPSGSSPWVDATFQDVSPGTVLLTFENVGLSSGEKLTELYFNLDPAKQATSLTFTHVSDSGGFVLPTISRGENAFQAGGDGKYDILFSFSQSRAAAFTAGEYLTYQITGITGLIASDFIGLSLPAGGHGPFLAAGHVQGINVSGGGSTSGWIAPSQFTTIPVPEPSSAALLLLTGISALYSRRFSRK